MADDDEIVQEGISDYWRDTAHRSDSPHESHGDSPSLDVDEFLSSTQERIDSARIALARRQPLNLQALYPKLTIVEEADPQHPEAGTGNISFDFFVYLTSFKESFSARWEKGSRSYGRLNPMYYYGGTNRNADISFTLPATNVAESRQNLSKCSELSRAVYGRYKRWSSEGLTVEQSALLGEQGLETGTDFTMLGHRYFRVDLGSLIRNERAFISAFTFTVNPDAGVFDYDNSTLNTQNGNGVPIDTDVTHSTKGLLLPKQVDVKISIIFKHDYPLGFGGPLIASNDRTAWAPNNGKDFPHGTGNHPLQSYMESVTTPQQAATDAALAEDPNLVPENTP